MKIDVVVGGGVLPATLDDSAPARDFATILPLERQLGDCHGVEKVAELGRRLDATGLPPSYEPKAGDITQYAPWSNLAFFIAPFSDSRGLVRLGQFDGPFEPLTASGDITVRIERAE